MSKIKFMALGGQDERGKSFVLDIDDNLFILDAGVKYPDKGILGVDIVTPKLDYLKIINKN
nr:hypothetical protein [Entomoplasma sp. MP1]